MELGPLATLAILAPPLPLARPPTPHHAPRWPPRQIHPMRIGNTMMNSMLFNVLLLLTTSVSVVQFCTRAFASYARLTAADMLFGVQVPPRAPTFA